MYDSTNDTAQDRVVPLPVEQPVRQPVSRAPALVRSSLVFLLSFAAVFGTAYLVITWPTIPQRLAFFLSEMTRGQSAVADAAVVQSATELDSDHDGFTDGAEIASGYDPFDPAPHKLDTDNDGLKDTLERDRYGTDPRKADSDDDGYSDFVEVTHGYSPLKPADFEAWVSERTTARLRIPRINVDVPVVWSQDADHILEDLKRGVVRYPGTGEPGKPGNLVISGHSSKYAWDPSSYGTAFVLIDQLKAGDKILVDYVGTTYTYQVTGQEINEPDDTHNFAPTPDAELRLITCWPINTTDKRLYVKAVLVAAQPIDQTTKP